MYTNTLGKMETKNVSVEIFFAKEDWRQCRPLAHKVVIQHSLELCFEAFATD